MIENLNPGNAISPIDGRYHSKTEELSECFSEKALMKYRLIVEVEYLIFLTETIKTIQPLAVVEKELIRNFYINFSEKTFGEIKNYEKTTNHDVNAVVRFLKGKLTESFLDYFVEWTHFGLTSEDINNISYAFMLRKGLEVLINNYKKVHNSIILSIVFSYPDFPMLSRTHGQPASPTTVDWESNVFCVRLERYIEEMKLFKIQIKFGGATGGHNALNVAYPGYDWRELSELFIDRLNNIEKTSMEFVYNKYTTQIEPHDTYAELFHCLIRANNVLADFSKDMWDYISRDVFTQKPVPGEDGSSAMPNKVNPIDFENAEGNLGMANCMFNYFANTLPISRLQRHLTDSTIIRNFGPAFAHTLISLKAICKGLSKVHLNEENVKEVLDDNWSVIAEAYQTLLRRDGIVGAYDVLKDLTRGKKVDKKLLHNFVDSLYKKGKISNELAEELKEITPYNYIGNRSLA